MTRKWLVTLTITLVIVAASKILHGQRVVNEMTPQLVAEAIKAGEKGDIADGVITKSSGWSWGSIHIATFSTPYMRVAMAARQAKKAYREEKMAAAIHPTRFEQMTALWQNLFGAEIRTLGMVATFPLSALSEENEVHVIYDRPATMGTNALGGMHCDDCNAVFSLKRVR